MRPDRQLLADLAAAEHLDLRARLAHEPALAEQRRGALGVAGRGVFMLTKGGHTQMAFLEQLAEAGATHVLVVRADLEAALELALDRGLLVHEEHHDVHRGVTKMDAQRRVVKLAAQRVQAVDQQLEALDLHLRAGEAVEDDAVAVGGLDELEEEQAHDLAVAHHVARVLDALGLGRVEQGADHDGFAGEPARLEDERGVRALARAGRAAEQDDFLGEAQLIAPVVLFQVTPDGVEDHLRVLDLEIVQTLGRARSADEGGGNGERGGSFRGGLGHVVSRQKDEKPARFRPRSDFFAGWGPLPA